jgi:hypothetical protein
VSRRANLWRGPAIALAFACGVIALAILLK